LGIGPNPQSPNPKPQYPNKIIYLINFIHKHKIKNKDKKNKIKQKYNLKVYKIK
jgi:hypothetical protein